MHQRTDKSKANNYDNLFKKTLTEPLEKIMSYQTIMVHLQLGHANTAVLNAAKHIAQRSNAAVIGIIVGQQTQMIYGKGYALIDFFDREQAQLAEKIAIEEALFRKHFAGHVAAIEWLSVVSMEPAIDFIVAQSCRADLIITSVAPSDFYDGPNSPHAGEIVMAAGRPVLAVPVSCKNFTLDNMLIGWKDSREARRVIADALPLLQLAKQITVLEIVAEDDKDSAAKRLKEVIFWLETHGVVAKPAVSIAKDADAIELLAAAKKHHADIVITGAYGHSRFREWVLGGVTNELLQGAHYCCFLSH